MKSLFRITLILALVIGGLSTAKSQDYSSAVGARLGSPIAASYKMFLGGSSNAIEAFVSYRNYGTTILGTRYGWTWIGVGAAYQIHKDIPSVDGLMWYFGGGASVVFFNYDDYYADDYDNLAIGIQGNLGLDYKFADLPINVSLDWVPTFYINGFYNGFGAGYGALSVRYVLKD
jgi:hypothetical protein